jgi:Short C-terminal domain
MNCPKCNSPDTQKFSTLYESGSSVGIFGGSGVGASQVGLSGSLFGGRTKNQTLLARRVAPPKLSGSDFSGPGMIWFAIFLIGFAVLLGFVGVFIAKEMILDVMIVPICFSSLGIFTLIGAVRARTRSAVDRRRREQERMEQWRNSWFCLRCGQEFVESSDSGERERRNEVAITPVTAQDIESQLSTLAKLKEQGLISESDYEQKKKQLLGI